MSEKLTDPRYQGMLSVYFDEMVETARRADIEVSARIKAGGKVVTKEEVVFTRPRFRIHELLARRSIDVVMRRSIAFDGRPVTGPKLEEHATTIGYKTFFGRVNRLFGDDKLLENAV